MPVNRRIGSLVRIIGNEKVSVLSFPLTNPLTLNGLWWHTSGMELIVLHAASLHYSTNLFNLSPSVET